uniref:Uncharacterized protein n=1 Tax=Phlegmariurus squarrosus TaxID=73615 RepID=H9M8C0_PHLSQ|nr:hypothetical protein HusqMp65 [Phlegmariurus squarrosus]AEV55827.1 hypothetical protein HusqMp65 [Phlegmariurus squarrosus]
MLKAKICHVELLGGPKVFHKKASHHTFQHLPRLDRTLNQIRQPPVYRPRAREDVVRIQNTALHIPRGQANKMNSTQLSRGKEDTKGQRTNMLQRNTFCGL